MNNNMTEKVIKIYNASNDIAKDNFSSEVDVTHVIKAMLNDEQSMLKNVLAKSECNINLVEQTIDGFINGKIKSSNVDKVYTSVDVNNLYKNAEKYQKIYIRYKTYNFKTIIEYS